MGVKHRGMVIYLPAVKGYLLRVDLNGIFFFIPNFENRIMYTDILQKLVTFQNL